MKAIMFVLVMLITINLVSAVGIKWTTEGININENSEKCVSYWGYNPSSNDLRVIVQATGSLSEVLISKQKEEKILKANTQFDQAEKLDFCFRVPKVYEANCLIGGILCKQTCGEEIKTYTGEVVLTEDVGTGEAMGSGATVSAAAPLSVSVTCTPYERNWTPVYITGIIIVLILIGMLFYKEYSTPKLVRDEERLKRLQEKIKTEKGKK